MDTPLEKRESSYIHIPKDIRILFVLAIVLIIARVLIFDSSYFIYLLWNIFLAVLPFVVSTILLRRADMNKLSKPLFVLGGIVWLLLLPNAPYIVTDLIHIGRGHGVPILYDTFLLFSSAWLGLMLFMHSLSHIEAIMTIMYSKRIAAIKIPSIIFLTSIGIYIGRYLRFNSWDVFADPSFFGDTWRTVVHPVHFVEACLFILPCFFFLYLSYRAWKTR
jgi:uncharacterized membrane protein